MSEASAEDEGRTVYDRSLPYGTVGERIASITLDNPLRWRWYAALGVSLALVALLVVSLAVVFSRGTGVWGNDVPTAWGFPIINYVWWIGLGNAGTLISALLLLINVAWRNSLNRFAEAMTVFAATIGAMFPILHLGRPELFYWTLPYPNTMALWPQFRSPLAWDVFAVLVYLIVSVLFWYVGLIPDLATIRDRAKTPFRQKFLGVLALGWRGSAIHWARWRQAYLIVAALAVPLVVSVHSGVGLLFAAGIVPGWHTTIFPPFFVLGAVFSGFALVTLLAVMVRVVFDLKEIITDFHLDMLAKWILGSGLIVGYCYAAETFHAWYSGDPFERETLQDRFFGEYAWSYWGLLIANLVPIQLLWFRRLRLNPWVLTVVGVSVLVGMWLERYMLLVTSLYQDYLVSSYGTYAPTFWDWSLFAGTLGLFAFLFLMFVRFLPLVSVFEVKEVIHEERRHG